MPDGSSQHGSSISEVHTPWSSPFPRGGVPVAFEVARALEAPLDVIVVRKLGVPLQPELGMGAIGEGGARVLNAVVVRDAGVSSEQIAAIERTERAELARRVRRFRGARERLSVAGRTAIIVDDGIATGSTARAACRVARAQGASHVVLAVPVAPPESLESLRHDADEVVCVETPEYFFAIGQWYGDFSQTPDDEVVALLESTGAGEKPAVEDLGHEARDAMDEEVEVHAGTVLLSGHLTMPEGARSVVMFAHGSGSSRHSPRNQFVASVLNRDRLGTLLFDLLTAEEELDRANVFDITLLARRLAEVTRWLRSDLTMRHTRVGYFGASTGAGAALLAAAEPHAADRCRRVAWGTPRPSCFEARRGSCSDLAHRGWPRRARARAEPKGKGSAAMREQAGDRSGGDASLRRARCPGDRCRHGEQLVHASSPRVSKLSPCDALSHGARPRTRRDRVRLPGDPQTPSRCAWSHPWQTPSRCAWSHPWQTPSRCAWSHPWQTPSRCAW